VEDSSKPIPNNSETTTPVVQHAVIKTGVYSNSDLDSSIIITVNNSENQGETCPVTSSVAGNSTCAQGGNGDTNVTTPVAGTEPGVRTGQWASNSYKNSNVNMCVKTSLNEGSEASPARWVSSPLSHKSVVTGEYTEDFTMETSCVENRSRESCCYGQRKLPERQSCCHEQRKLPDPRDRQSCCHGQRKLPDRQSCCHEQRKPP